MAQVSNIYNNAKDYIGTQIRYQGVFGRYAQDGGGVKNYYVVRYGPGCCGNDAFVGFEVVLEGNPPDESYPENDDWVLAEGELEEYEYESEKVLRIRLSSLKVMAERGQEFVKN